MVRIEGSEKRGKTIAQHDCSVAARQSFIPKRTEVYKKAEIKLIKLQVDVINKDVI